MSISTPKPTGNYAVGTFTYTVKDDREEVLQPGTMRSVASRVYYPVLKSQVGGRSKARYLSRNMMQSLKKSFYLPLNYDKLEAAGENLAECFEDAPRIEGVKFPLIVFNHGYGSFREGNSYLCIELSSHGYVVISVAHSLEGTCTEFDDGSCLFLQKGISMKTYQPFWRGILAALRITKAKGSLEEVAQKFDVFQDQYCGFMKERLGEWVKDTRAAVDYAKQNLSDLIDFEKGIGASGHSFGGNTAYALCAEDPDFVCGINIDGSLFGAYKDTVQKKPFMQVSCKIYESIVSRVYLRHTQPVYKVLFRDMQHMGFSDMKYRIKLSTGKLDPDAMHENLCRCHLAFFDAYLKGLSEKPDLKSNDVITITEYAPDL